VVIGWGQGM